MLSLPHGRDLIHLVPLEGAKPPVESLLMDSSPHQALSVPRPIVSPQETPVLDLVLPEEWTLEERWNHLNSPLEPDLVATEMAVNGITLKFKDISPPLVRWRVGSQIRPTAIPEAVKMSPRQIPFLIPFILAWLEQDIVTDNICEIPDRVHVSRLFHVPKEKDKIRPIID